MDTKADMDGAMVELPGGIEAIRALDSAQTEGARIEARSEQLRKKEMRHHRAMAFYDCCLLYTSSFALGFIATPISTRLFAPAELARVSMFGTYTSLFCSVCYLCLLYTSRCV